MAIFSTGNLRILFLVSIFTSFAHSAWSQKDEKIEKILEKQFQKQQFDKCKKTAHKFKKKTKSIIPYYYLSRIELEHYSAVDPRPSKTQWRYLKQSTTHINKLKCEYPDWVEQLKKAYEAYIISWKDSTYTSAHVKTVVKAYTKVFGDTLTVYYSYYGKLEESSEKAIEYSVPKTDSLRTELLSFASQWVGTPYKYAGESPETGFDCSGFVLYVYKHIGVELPHSAQMQSELSGKILSLEEAEPGDLIFFGRANGNKWRTQHAGIYYGNENGEPKVIHCVSGGVSIDGNNTSWDYYWKDLILFAIRLPALEN